MGSERASAGVGESIEIQLQEASEYRHVQRRLGRRGLLAIMVTAAMLVWLLILAAKPAPLPGVQVDGLPDIRMAQATEMEWDQLVSQSGDERPGFPEPMVWRGDRICVGFGRVDFSPEQRRPSVARCVDPPDVRTAGPSAIATLMTLASGLDTWHFIEASSEVGDVRVTLAEGERLGADRIYVLGSIFALRLPNERELRELEWSTAPGSWRCTPEAEAWRTSVFCSLA